MDFEQQMQDRFGKKATSELQCLDSLQLSALWRLYLVSSIASNIHTFDVGLAQNFYNQQTRNINMMIDDLDKMTQDFQDSHGEI